MNRAGSVYYQFVGYAVRGIVSVSVFMLVAIPFSWWLAGLPVLWPTLFAWCVSAPLLALFWWLGGLTLRRAARGK